MINEMLITQEQRENLKKKELLRKQGESFIRVINMGPAGFNFIHAIEDIKLFEYPDPDTGMPQYRKERGSNTINFEEDQITGERVAEILDTEFNRYFLSRHLTLDDKPLFVIENKKIAREISALTDKPFMVEPDKKVLLSRQKAEIERELTRIKHEEEKERKKEKEQEMSTNKPGGMASRLGDRIKETFKQPQLDSPSEGT